MLSPETLEWLRCPSCESTRLAHAVFREESPTDIVDGVVWCQDCNHWYPIEERLLDFLVGPLAYDDDRSRFWGKYEDRLTALGLDPRSDADTTSKDLQKHQQDHFDWYAENLDQSYFEYEQTSFWRAADLIAFEPWKKAVTPGSRLLDVGCAQGRSTFKFMDCDIQIVAFDVSKALIRQAIARYQEGGHRARAVFFAADASRFPLRDKTFDTVLVYGVLHHLADPAVACREISRVLKAGGSYIGQENNQTVFRSVFDLLQKLRPQWHEEAGPEAIISSERLRNWFSDTPVEVESKTSVFLPPHLCNLMTLSTSHRMLVATDRLGRAIPYLREQGGVLLIHGLKS
jgi:ubiquinone/menaquinone biosynthesis C-methylase UbiE/uncharacterized protein YbaR (Trm112 family)